MVEGTYDQGDDSKSSADWFLYIEMKQQQKLLKFNAQVGKKIFLLQIMGIRYFNTQAKIR